MLICLTKVIASVSMKKRSWYLLGACLMVVALASAASITFRAAAKTNLIIYTADAYTGEASYLASQFSTQYHVPVAPPISGGSYALAREIQQGAPDSVFFSVALNAYTDSYLGARSSGWAIAFAVDQMVIAYSNATLNNPVGKSVVLSFEEAKLNGSTAAYFSAFSALTAAGDRIGVSDPNSDPAGFRAWIVLEEAGYLYANHSENYFVDRLIADHDNVTASNAAQLVAPLFSGQIEFLFIYRSAAQVKGLSYISLSPAINLGDPAYSSFYYNFTYNLSSGTVHASPIYLFVSVPVNAVAQKEALLFVVFTVNNSAALERFGLIPLNPCYLFNSSAVPPQVTGLLSTGRLTLKGSLSE
jgi:molybdate/tungstate transport system substrate-binding protein